MIGEIELDLREQPVVDLTIGDDEIAPGRPGVAWQPA